VKINFIKLGRALLWVVYAWMTVTIVLLVLAFLLQLLGADQSADFVEWVYRSTRRAMAPFRGIFDSITLSDDSVFDVSILFAIIVYCFVAMAIHVGLDWLTSMLRRAEDNLRHDEMVAAQAAAARAQPTSRVGHVVQLNGPHGVTGTAVLTEHATGTYVDLTVTGLDPGRQYTVWSEADTGGRIDAGAFLPGSAGPTRVKVTSPLALAHTQLFGVSVSGLPGEAASTDVLAARLA
jgi:hypothetical protein